MKNNLKYFTFLLVIIALIFANIAYAKELQEGQLYHTSFGPPQLAIEKPSTEPPVNPGKNADIFTDKKSREEKTFFEKTILSKTDKDHSEKKKVRNKYKIKSMSLRQKRNIRKAKSRNKLDFKDKNGDGYDDRHKADDL